MISYMRWKIVVPLIPYALEHQGNALVDLLRRIEWHALYGIGNHDVPLQRELRSRR